MMMPFDFFTLKYKNKKSKEKKVLKDKKNEAIKVLDFFTTFFNFFSITKKKIEKEKCALRKTGVFVLKTTDTRR
jgi:hypothetical protein